MTRLAFLALIASGSAALQAEEAPICTDRPTKANAVCTVPAGAVQVETSLLGWSRSDERGSRTELLTVAASFVKFGLTGNADLQIGFTPFARASNAAEQFHSERSGVGDVIVRYKYRMTGDDAEFQVAVSPFVKVPTASRGLGNGRFEGGLAVPVSFPLAGPVTMTLGPEADLLVDAQGGGRHLALVNIVNMSAPIAPRITIAGELWTNFDFDPAGTREQASADLALAYSVSGNVQLDLGANIGLTRDTPDLEFYTGLSLRF